MRLLQKIIAVIFLVLWVPLTTHCLWEDQFAGGLFKCATATAEKGDCSNQDDCSALETGTYRSIQATVAVPVPLLTVVLFQIPPPEFSDADQLVAQTAGPDEIPRSWLFFSRTALPPRAPSSVS